MVCNECGKKFRSQAQAEFHASKSQHTDFSESTEEIAPLTEEEKKQKLEELRQKLAAKRAVQSEQDKVDKKRNEVCLPLRYLPCRYLRGRLLTGHVGNPAEEHQGVPRHQGGARAQAENEGSGQEESRETG